MLVVAVQPSAVFTGTVMAPGNSVSASRQITSSPETRPTGTPCTPAASAFTWASDAVSPFTRNPVKNAENECDSTPGSPAAAW